MPIRALLFALAAGVLSAGGSAIERLGVLEAGPLPFLGVTWGVTGLLYLNADSQDVHQQNDTIGAPLYNMPHEQLCPGNDALQKLMGQFR